MEALAPRSEIPHMVWKAVAHIERRSRGMERMWLFHEDIELFHRAPLSLPRPHARARPPAHDTSVSVFRTSGRAATTQPWTQHNQRTTRGRLLPGKQRPQTRRPLHVHVYPYCSTCTGSPVPECVPCVSTRVNVNTTDATTGATALLLPAPCVSRVCPGSPGVFLNTRNYSVTTEHVV